MRIRSTHPMIAFAFGMAASACSSECLVPPCPFPIAVQIDVTSATTHAALTNASVVVNGDTARAIACNQACIVPGGAGRYALQITAPGFQPAARVLDVTSSGKSGCGTCEITNGQTLDIALVPSA